MNGVEKDSYRSFLSEIKSKVYQAQYEAMKQVNTRLVMLYWEIGKEIIEKQQQYGLGQISRGTTGRRPSKRIRRNGWLK